MTNKEDLKKQLDKLYDMVDQEKRISYKAVSKFKIEYFYDAMLIAQQALQLLEKKDE